MKPDSIYPQLPISKGSIRWLLFCLIISISWHIPHTPIWVLVAVFSLIYWRYQLMNSQRTLPPKIIRFFLTTTAFFGVLVTYHSFLGRDPSITALILLSTLKLLELKSPRDFMFIIFLCYFLVFGNFLYSQSIPVLLFTMVAVIIITATILRLNYGEKDQVKLGPLLKLALRFFVFSIPFMVVLFLLFPRTSGPLWNLPQDSDNKGITGFSGTIQPGQIAELAQSTEPAFRVTFPDNNIPQPKNLYFRGMVLWFTNGRIWYQYQAKQSSRISKKTTIQGKGIQQIITLEPHYKQWFFALDLPMFTPEGIFRLPGNVYYFYEPIEKHVRYNVVSTLQPALSTYLPTAYRRWGLQLPRSRSQRIIRLVKSWRSSVSTDEKIVQKALDYFRDSSFIYTLTPGPLNLHSPTEDFLFNTRRGFCEHFAAAFTLLMRTAQIPARIIIGYQGGEYNPVGGYLMVRQANAHAWSEVWLEGKGWQRIDPTAVVSPERIEYGVELSRRLQSLAALQSGNRTENLRRAMQKGFFKKIFENIQYHWDNINNNWNLWIMSYDRYRQVDFFKALGLIKISYWNLIVVMIIFILVLGVLTSYIIQLDKESADPVVKQYLLFCKKLSKFGIKRFSWEGPLDLQNRSLQVIPHKKKEIKEITDLYINYRFGKSPLGKQTLKKLKIQVSRL